jgi:hypothetical protein
MTSPPNPFSLASTFVINPWEVETMAMPLPLKTVGILSFLTYKRKPGRETRLILVDPQSPLFLVIDEFVIVDIRFSLKNSQDRLDHAR